MLPTFFLRRPLIFVEGHNGRELEIIYRPSEWEQAATDFAKLNNAIAVCQKALQSVPMVEPLPPVDLKKLE
jgi:hypothetical protein